MPCRACGQSSLDEGTSLNPKLWLWLATFGHVDGQDVHEAFEHRGQFYKPSLAQLGSCEHLDYPFREQAVAFDTSRRSDCSFATGDSIYCKLQRAAGRTCSPIEKAPGTTWASNKPTLHRISDDSSQITSRRPMTQVLVKVTKARRSPALARALSELGFSVLKQLPEHHKLLVAAPPGPWLSRIRGLGGVERVHVATLVADTWDDFCREVQEVDWLRQLELRRAAGQDAFPSERGEVPRYFVRARTRGKNAATQAASRSSAASELQLSSVNVLEDALRSSLKCGLPQAQPAASLQDANLVVWLSAGRSVVCGLPVLFRRSSAPNLPFWGLHRSVAFALGAAAKLREGELVLDPFAGRGALLAALARRWPSRFLGFELDPTRVTEAEANFQATGLRDLAEVRCADARQLPLSDASLPALDVWKDSVDVVVSDLPFGRKYGSVEDNRSLYPAAFREVARVLRPGGRGVVATGDESAEILDSALAAADLCRVGAMPFAFGGNSDDAGCKAVCFAKGCGERELFDWSLAEAEGDWQRKWRFAETVPKPWSESGKLKGKDMVAVLRGVGRDMMPALSRADDLLRNVGAGQCMICSGSVRSELVSLPWTARPSLPAGPKEEESRRHQKEGGCELEATASDPKEPGAPDSEQVEVSQLDLNSGDAEVIWIMGWLVLVRGEYLANVAVSVVEDSEDAATLWRELEEGFLPMLQEYEEISPELASSICEKVIEDSDEFLCRVPNHGPNLLLMYGGSPEPLLKGAQLEIRRGHRYGVVGSNGSGKTTLMARWEITERTLSVPAGGFQPPKDFSRLASKDLMGLPEVRDYVLQRNVGEGAASEEVSLRGSRSVAFKAFSCLVAGRRETQMGDHGTSGSLVPVLAVPFVTTWHTSQKAVRTWPKHFATWASSERHVEHPAGRPEHPAKHNSSYALDQRKQQRTNCPVEEQLGQAVLALSGGWQMRLALACAVARKANLLLLDEPTNHLDVEGVQWLVDFIKRTCQSEDSDGSGQVVKQWNFWHRTAIREALKGSVVRSRHEMTKSTWVKGAALIVSHDPDFLDRVCTEPRFFYDVVHFSPSNQKGKLAYYPGTFSAFKAEGGNCPRLAFIVFVGRSSSWASALNGDDAEAERLLETAEKAAPDRPGIGLGPNDGNRMAFPIPEKIGDTCAERKASSEVTALRTHKTLAEHSDQAPVVTLEKASFKYKGSASPVLHEISAELGMASRVGFSVRRDLGLGPQVGIVGKNGSGMLHRNSWTVTVRLLALLAGRLEPSEVDGRRGRLSWHKDLRLAYIAARLETWSRVPGSFLAFASAGKTCNRHSIPSCTWGHLPSRLSDDRGPSYVDKTPLEYMQARFRRGFDEETPIDDKTKAKEKDREYLYEVKWKELSPAENSYESVSRLEGSRCQSINPRQSAWEALKLVQDLDDRIWTAWAGSQQRPLTDREILSHLEPFGLDEDVVCSRKISMLSSGQKCKLALGAAFWTRPHVVCLDEPTNYLDTETVELLKRAIRTFRGGCAAVSHSEKFVEEVCDEIWTVDEANLQDQTQSITLLKNRFFWEEALRVFLLAGNAADVISFNAALSVCEWSRQWEQALSLLVAAADSDVVSYNTVVSACAKSSAWVHALLLLWEDLLGGGSRTTADIISFNAGISACEKAAKWELALELVQALLLQGLQADIFTWNAALSACASAGNWEQAFEVLNSMQLAHLRADAVSCSAAVTACAGASRWDLALHLFFSMRGAADHIAWNTVVAAVTTWELSLQLLQEMDQAKFEPDVVAFSSVVGCCAEDSSADSWLAALEILQNLGAQRLSPNEVTYSAAITALGRAQQWQRALETLAVATTAGAAPVAVWNAAIDACERGGKWEQALQLLGELEVNSGAPAADLISFCSATGACAVAAEWQKASGRLQRFCVKAFRLPALPSRVWLSSNGGGDGHRDIAKLPRCDLPLALAVEVGGELVLMLAVIIGGGAGCAKVATAAGQAKDFSRCPAAQGGEPGANLYEAWVRNSLAKRVTMAPDIGGRALCSLQLLQHVLEPMVKCASVTSSEHFTVQEICLTQANFFRCLQQIYPNIKATLIVRCWKLLCTLPSVLVKALRAPPAWRPFFWSSWFWMASLPLRTRQLPAEAEEINVESNQDPRIATIQPLFRGCHQLVEIACRFALDRAASAAEEEKPAKALMEGAQLLQAMAQVLNILAQLDVCAYQEYRPALKGTSGGDSIALRQLTRLCRSLQVTGDEMRVRGSAGRDLLNAVHSFQYGIGLFWSAHLGLAVTSNGIDTTGTAGLSIRQMFVHLESVLNSRFSQWIPRFAAGCPTQSKWVWLAGAAKEVGEAIFDSLGCEAVPPPLPTPSKDGPEKLFEDRWSRDFRSFSMAPPLKAELVNSQQLFIDHISRLDLGYFYSQVLPEFRDTVRDLLHLDSRAAIGTSANLSESLSRVLLALAQRERHLSDSGDCVVISGSADFLSIRSLWRILAHANWKRVEVEQSGDDQAAPFLEAIEQRARNVRLVHVTAVSSVGQIAMTSSELKAIVMAARAVGAAVIVDICQAFCNIDYDFASIMGGELGDVFLMGSCMKHGRSLEGLGFCAFDPASSLRPWLSPGWCADLSAIQTPMEDPELADAFGAMEGGTVANAVHTELFVKQQRYLHKSGMGVKAINRYVLHLQESFLSRLGVSLEGETIAGEVVGWTRRQNDEVSKALTLRSGRASQLAQALQEKGFQCDSRHGSYLRLGFDICHSEADAVALADAVRQVARRRDPRGVCPAVARDREARSEPSCARQLCFFGTSEPVVSLLFQCRARHFAHKFISPEPKPSATAAAATTAAVAVAVALAVALAVAVLAAAVVEVAAARAAATA
ncbi:TEF3 [Symbiodinium sp. CCMP2456]|nr:TEF3 [Symbiodinium sp. CCMP2456]